MLAENGVNVFAVKTGAFTIRQTQLQTARELLNWKQVIANNWRLHNTDDIKFPH